MVKFSFWKKVKCEYLKRLTGNGWYYLCFVKNDWLIGTDWLLKQYRQRAYINNVHVFKVTSRADPPTKPNHALPHERVAHMRNCKIKAPRTLNRWTTLSKGGYQAELTHCIPKQPRDRNRVNQWYDLDQETIHGALLLPASNYEGNRLQAMVAFVEVNLHHRKPINAGENGSKANTFKKQETSMFADPGREFMLAVVLPA